MPKFSGDEKTKQWWRFKETFTDEPEYVSAIELKENQKIWAKNDDLKLADINSAGAPLDPFKTSHIQQPKKDEVAPKIHTVTHWTPNDDSNN